MNTQQYPWRGIIGWAYEADVHCNAHAIERFTEAGLFDLETRDSEGNMPYPICNWDAPGDCGDYCRECLDDCITDMNRKWCVEPTTPHTTLPGWTHYRTRQQARERARWLRRGGYPSRVVRGDGGTMPTEYANIR